MKEYFEAHVTMLGDPAAIRPHVEDLKWKFSCIDGDINLGAGVKCYATLQMNTKIGEGNAKAKLVDAAEYLGIFKGITILRRKIERVIFDDRIDKVACIGACPECIGISPSDPMMILAGIKQFGLAPDGADLRDLEAAIGRLKGGQQ